MADVLMSGLLLPRVDMTVNGLINNSVSLIASVSIVGAKPESTEGVVIRGLMKG